MQEVYTGTIGPQGTPLETRLWVRVVKTETCWLYGGPKYGNRYGQLSRGPGLGNTTAHRLSYELHHGTIPAGLFVCHKCDVKNCVNPDHLYAGTHEQNTQDIIDRKRFAHGNGRVRQLNAKGKRYRYGKVLDKQLADQLRAEYASGQFTQMQLAARYRISQSAVCTCIRGATYWSKPNDQPKGRRNLRHFRRKLTVEQCDEIRRLYATGQYTQTALGAQFGVSYAHVSNLVLRKDRRSIRESASPVGV